MRLQIDRPTPAWSEVSIELTREEIEELIALLRAISEDADQHFHLTSSSHGGAEGVQLTFAQESPGAQSDAQLSSLAIPPGSEV